MNIFLIFQLFTLAQGYSLSWASRRSTRALRKISKTYEGSKAAQNEQIMEFIRNRMNNRFLFKRFP